MLVLPLSASDQMPSHSDIDRYLLWVVKVAPGGMVKAAEGEGRYSRQTHSQGRRSLCAQAGSSGTFARSWIYKSCKTGRGRGPGSMPGYRHGARAAWCCPGRLLRVNFRSGGTLVVAFKIRCSLQSDLEARLARLKSSENIVPLKVPKELAF